jgi:hypothetical protein
VADRFSRLHYSAGLAALLIVVLIGVSAVALYQERVQGEALAAVTTRNLAQALDHTVSEIIARTDQALLTVEDLYEESLARGEVDADAVERLIERQFRLLRHVDSLRIATADGTIRHGIGVRASPGQQVTERAYFRAHRDGDGQKLIVSEPVVGKISRKWVVIFSRRLDAPGGRFAGVVYAGVLVESLTRLFAELDLGPKGVVALRDAHMGLVARYPDLETSANPVGGRSVSPEMMALLQSGRRSATYFARGGPDRVERAFTFRRLEAAPLVLVVGISRESYLSSWHRSVRGMVVVLAVSLLATGLALLALRRAAAREEGTLRELANRLARTRRLEGIISVCLYCKRINNDNRSWEQMEKYLSENSDAQFSHAICPECFAKHRDD